MNFSDYINAAITKARSAKAAAEIIGTSDTTLHDARRGARGLPEEQCARLADYLGVPWPEVIAARNEQRAKNPEEAQFWRSRRAASWLCAAAIGTLMTTGNDANACETTVVSPTSETRTTTGLEATPAFAIHILRSIARAIRRAATAIYRTLAAPLRTVRPAALNIG